MSNTSDNHDEQAQRANAFARANFGAEVDAAAGASGLKVLEPTDRSDPPKAPWVELPGAGNRDVGDFAADMGAVMCEMPIFRRDGLALPVTVDPFTGDITVMTAMRFMSWVSKRVIVFEEVTFGRGDKQATKRFRKTMPKTTAQCCLEADEFLAQLRPLVRVNMVRTPWMSPDGVPVLLPEGYHEGSQIFTLASGVAIDEAMPLEKAKRLFADYYGEFGFTDARSLAVALTMPLALWGIGLQCVEAARPGFMVRANTQGGGKSLVAQMGITPAYGLPKATPRAKEEELRKTLDAAVLQGAPYLFFDNQKGHFENALVEGFMTSPVHQARVMGTQRLMNGKVCCVMIITGNNLTVSPDMQRRLLQCDLFVEEFELQEKDHKRDLNPVVLNRPHVRGEFLSALWAMIRHWNEAGRPKAGDAKRAYRIAGFAEWSDIFGGIIQAAGYGNPLEKPKDDQIAAPRTLHQRLLVEKLATPLDDSTPQMDYTFQDLIDCCHEHEWFGWMMKGGKEKDLGEGKSRFELNAEIASTMGIMFTKEMGDRQGRVFQLSDGRRVRFKKEGEGRGKRYTVALMPTVKTASV